MVASVSVNVVMVSVAGNQTIVLLKRCYHRESASRFPNQLHAPRELLLLCTQLEP
uniref:Uncharacterized protein n=1 Tax=Lotus japonicus TaxID=34305 RepID=I3SVQ1_LOTJA|nr:unknown [Lotus japonicus]